VGSNSGDIGKKLSEDKGRQFLEKKQKFFKNVQMGETENSH
jgi:hypothetical protein